MDQRIALVVFLAASFGAAAVGVIGQGSDTPTFYAALDRPPWAPPAWLFGPVWTVLYALIGVSAWLVWRDGGWGPALTAWTVQLVLNAAWTPVFFGLRRFGAAFAVIVVLLVAILVTAWLMRERSQLAAWLLAPYAVWVAFATALNASLLARNGASPGT
jgi:benzodiazapine receptor